jgi:UDP:flavonoid glycosyltransferase YjiC (YdhE family)
VVKPRVASAARLEPAIAQVLESPGYRARSSVIAQEIAGAGGVARAADLIESRLL